MNYPQRLLAHLARYRREALGISEPGVFRHRGNDLLIEHILPKERAWLGVPVEKREMVHSFCTEQSVKLHRYFHHLNSSQAFALSLFVPFFQGDTTSSSSLLRALGVEGTLVSWYPEYVPDTSEGTNHDAWWRTSSGAQYFCEVKLTESKFGVAANDGAHRRKLEVIYTPRLQGHIKPQRLEQAQFFAAYQILRQLWHAAGSDASYAMFLYPRQREDLTDIIIPVLEDITSPLRDRVVTIHAEDVLARVIADASCPEHLREYARRLADKYLL